MSQRVTDDDQMPAEEATRRRDKSKRSFTYDVYSPHGPTRAKLSEAVSRVRHEGLFLGLFPKIHNV